MTIRNKLIIGFLGVSLLVCVGSGWAFYSLQERLHLESFLNAKLQLVKALASALPGDDIKRFSTPTVVGEAGYRTVLHYLNQVRLADPFITYLYVLIPAAESQGFVYAVDGDINQRDKVWVEGRDLALILTRDANDQLQIQYNQSFEQSGAPVVVNGQIRSLKIEVSTWRTRLKLGDDWLLDSLAGSPWQVGTPGGLVNAQQDTREFLWTSAGQAYPLTVTFTAAGASASSPGAPFVAAAEQVAEYSKILAAGEAFVYADLRADNYGQYREAVGVIKDSQQRPVGLVLLDVYQGELAKFVASFLERTQQLVIFFFCLCFVISFLVARHVTWPLNGFLRLAQKVRAGDLSVRMTLRRRDDYGALAETVNQMLDKLESMTGEMNRHALELDYQANHDSVTGLSNRRAFFQQLDGLIGLFSRLPAPPISAIFFLDLDKFKEINDTLGHQAGDQLLKMVSERLKASVRDSDLVYRLGGDEFVILASPLAREEDAAHVARKISLAVSEPFDLSGHFVPIGVSQGIAFYPQDGRDAETLIKNADTALYESKRHGAGPVYFTPSMTEKVEKAARLREEVFAGLRQREFFLVYQPILDLRGRLVSAEALMRWKRADGQFVSPADFIPVLEDSSLIGQAGLWALETAQAQLEAWEHVGFGGFSVSVNLSIRQLRDADFLKHFDAFLSSRHYDPKRLYFEITETMIAKDPLVLRLITEYFQRGVPFALDDFGTGYSSLSSITSLPISVLKIDKHFVDLLPHDPKMCSIVRAIVQIAEAIGVVTVAEGVERAEQFDYLASIGCARFQGYHFAKPLLPDELRIKYHQGT